MYRISTTGRASLCTPQRVLGGGGRSRDSRCTVLVPQDGRLCVLHREFWVVGVGHVILDVLNDVGPLVLLPPEK